MINLKRQDYKIKIEKKIIEEKLKEIANQNKQFEDKKKMKKQQKVIKLHLIIQQQLTEINLMAAKEKVFK